MRASVFVLCISKKNGSEGALRGVKKTANKHGCKQLSIKPVRKIPLYLDHVTMNMRSFGGLTICTYVRYNRSLQSDQKNWSLLHFLK